MSERVPVAIAGWAPREWACNGFPLPEPGAEVVTLEYVLAALERYTAAITAADSTVLGAAMHVAHILVTLQGADGAWPAALELRTGLAASAERTRAPVKLMRRLNRLLRSTEFDYSIRKAAHTCDPPGLSRTA